MPRARNSPGDSYLDHPVDHIEPMPEDELAGIPPKVVVFGLSEILDWILDPNVDRSSNPNSVIALRCMAVKSIIMPPRWGAIKKLADKLGMRTDSLSHMGKRFCARFGTTPQAMNALRMAGQAMKEGRNAYVDSDSDQ